jgi:hypothetical protein
MFVKFIQVGGGALEMMTKVVIPHAPTRLNSSPQSGQHSLPQEQIAFHIQIQYRHSISISHVHFFLRITIVRGGRDAFYRRHVASLT